MKTPLQLALMALVLVTLFCMRSDASNVEYLAQQPDIICIASLKSKTDLREDVPSSALPHKTILVTLDIKSMWKGDPPAKPFTLRAKVFDWDAFSRQGGGTVSIHGDDFTNFKPGANYLIFAQRDKGDDYFTLVNSSEGIESAWKIGPLSPDVSPDSSAEQNIYTQFVSTLSSADPEVKVSSLMVAAGLGGLFWDKPDPDFATVPDTSNLNGLAKTRVIPAVLRMMKSSDAEVRSDALYAAANFQLPQAIPILEAAANDNTNESEAAAEYLGLYKTGASVPALIGLLRNGNTRIKRYSIATLQIISNQGALPALLIATHNPDANVRYDAFLALYRIASNDNAADPLERDQFSSREPALDKFWQSWAAMPAHKVEMKEWVKQAQSEYDAAVRRSEGLWPYIYGQDNQILPANQP